MSSQRYQDRVRSPPKRSRSAGVGSPSQGWGSYGQRTDVEARIAEERVLAEKSWQQERYGLEAKILEERRLGQKRLRTELRLAEEKRLADFAQFEKVRIELEDKIAEQLLVIDALQKDANVVEEAKHGATARRRRARQRRAAAKREVEETFHKESFWVIREMRIIRLRI